MTCIAGIAHRGVVMIAGDSAGTNSSSQQVIRLDSKVFLRGEFVFGCSSSFRMTQLIRYSLQIPPYEQEIEIAEYMATIFIDAVRDCLKNGGYAKSENNREEGGRFLVGFCGRLFCIESDYQVEETLSGYNAIGSGDDLALGALFATQHLDKSSEERLELALEAAAHHNSDTRKPFNLVSIGKSDSSVSV